MAYFSNFAKQGELTVGRFADDAWDENVYGPIIVKDDTANLYRLYYTAFDAGGEYGPAMATSTDLLTWTKPNLGQISYGGNSNNNLLIDYSELNLSGIDYINGEFVAVLRNSTSTSNLIYTSNDGETFGFVKTAFNNTTHGEYVESKGIRWNGSVYRIYYNQGHLDEAGGRRSIGYYECATLGGTWVDQGLVSEWTSSSTTDQYYDFQSWEHAGILWACVPPYKNSVQDLLGPLDIYSSTDDGATWGYRGVMLDFGANGEFDDALLATAKPVLFKGKWYLIYAGSPELHFTPGRVTTLGLATATEVGPVKTLHHEFARSKSLAGLVGPAASCARAGTAGYYDLSGVYQYAAANTAAFDHDPITLESFGLSLMETRVNLVSNPEDFSTGWTAEGASIDTNAATFIDDATSMDRLNVTAAAEIHRAFQQITNGAGVRRLVECFFKDDGASYVGLSWLGATDDWCTVVADLTAGTVTQVSTGATTGTIADSGIEQHADGRYRLWMIATCATANPYIAIQTHSSSTPTLSTGGNESFTGVAGNDVFVCGAAVTYAVLTNALLPYHPTTHNTDVITWSDVSWYNDSAGTWYFRVRPIDLSVDNFIFAIGAGSSGSDALSVWFDQPSGTIAAFRGTTTGDDGFISMAAVASVDTWVEIAVAYQNNDMVMYVDGVAGTPDTSVTVPPTTAADTAKAGLSQDGVSPGNCYLGAIRYADERLGDSTVQEWSLGIFHGPSPAPGFNTDSLARNTRVNRFALPGRNDQSYRLGDEDVPTFACEDNKEYNRFL